MSTESMMPSNHLILCHPLLLLPSIFPSIKVFSSESALGIRCPKYWSFSFNIRPFNEYSRLISFGLTRIDFLWIDKDWQVWSPCSPRDSQESSLTLQFKSISSLMLSLLYGPTLNTLAVAFFFFRAESRNLLMAFHVNMSCVFIIPFQDWSSKVDRDWWELRTLTAAALGGILYFPFDGNLRHILFWIFSSKVI